MTPYDKQLIWDAIHKLQQEVKDLTNYVNFLGVSNTDFENRIKHLEEKLNESTKNKS
jgi:hypothetical protein